MSHRVPGRVACPWCLYYARYYTEAAISTSQSAETLIRRARVCHSTADRWGIGVVRDHRQVPLSPASEESLGALCQFPYHVAR